MDVDDEDLLPPTDLILFLVINFVCHDEVQQHPAVAQEDAKHEVESAYTETTRSRIGHEILLDVSERCFDTPTPLVQLDPIVICL